MRAGVIVDVLIGIIMGVEVGVLVAIGVAVRKSDVGVRVKVGAGSTATNRSS